MITLPNLISLMRFPLAFLFLQENVFYRSLAILLAMVSDGLDGYLARRYSLSSKLGTLLDPLMDKFFAFFVLTIFVAENKLQLWEAAALICRDFSVLFFGLYLAFRGNFFTYRFRAIWCGKLTTFLQFTVFLALIFQIPVSPYLYLSFFILGFLALLELYLPIGFLN